jgi:tetratricopeptide (TPR) repeat protein
VRNFNARALLFVLLASFAFLMPPASAPAQDDAAYKAERESAINLFNQNKFMEALPLFEDLAAKNPNDDKALLGLAACLVDHSATLSDAQTAGKERIRAKDLLLRARNLGNSSTLLQNLLQVLQALPQGGEIKYSENPAADAAMHAAEKAFAQRDYDEAIKDYSHALDLDPRNSTAALFVGDSYFAEKDFANAGVWYGRASQIDPNSETPYRYYADMLTKAGDMEGARTKAIEAVIAEPYNPITWRGLQQWANVNHVQLIRMHVNIPNNVTQKAPNQITINVPAGQQTDSTAAWLAYSLAQASWHGDEFHKRFPNETQYRHSLAEEADALKMAADVWSEVKKNKKSEDSVDPDLDLLLKLEDAGAIEPYVLLNAADEGIAQDYADYRDKNRAKLEQYLSQFVVPPAPSRQ